MGHREYFWGRPHSAGCPSGVALFDAARISEAIDFRNDKHDDKEECRGQTNSYAYDDERCHVAPHVAPISEECRGTLGKSEEFCATGATRFEGLNRS